MATAGKTAKPKKSTTRGGSRAAKKWEILTAREPRRSGTKPKRAKASAAVTSEVPRKSAVKTYAKRPDLGAPVDTFIQRLPDTTRPIVEELRGIVKRAAPGAEESIKWGMPVFSQNGLLCYLKPLAGAVRFGFYDQGIDLTDPDGLLTGTGERMRHVKVTRPGEIRHDLFERWVRQAVDINTGR
jgi:hypothetical protein